MTLENEGGDNTNYPYLHQKLLSSMILKFPVVHNLRRLLNLISLQDRQVHLVYRQDDPPAPSPLGGREGVETGNTSCERLYPHPRPSPLEPQLIPTPTCDVEDDQPPQERGNDNGLDRLSEYVFTYQCAGAKNSTGGFCRIR